MGHFWPKSEMIITKIQIDSVNFLLFEIIHAYITLFCIYDSYCCY